MDSDEETTDQQGLFATASWRPNKVFRLEADFDEASYDDPFTLSSPTDRRHYRLKARLRSEQGLFASATLLAHRFENDDSGWTADRDQWSLRAGYRREGIQIDGGFTRFESDRAIDQTVTTRPGFGGGVQFLVSVLYQSDADLFDLRGRWQAHERLTFGTHLRWWDNEGSFANERQDLGCYADVAIANGYSARLAYRTIDYQESARFDDYDAEIVELSVGYRW
ncbi:MAG: hypothetical protein AAF481_08725 [Acidobacteriota bacterium]